MQWRWQQREWLGPCASFAGDVGLWDGAFFDRKYRLAGLPVQHKNVSHLGGLHYHVSHSSALHDGREHRLRRDIVVPQVVVHGLEMPGDLAGLCAQGDQRIREQVVSRSHAAVEVRRRAGGGNEHQAAPGICRDDRPGVCGAGSPGAVAVPGFTARHALSSWNRIPVPQELAAARIEGANIAVIEIDFTVIADRRTNHNDVVDDGRWRGDAVLAAPEVLDASRQLQFAVDSEVCAALAAFRIEDDEACVEGAENDPIPARVVFGRVRICPETDTS